jgi:hypothetical protein
VVHPQGVELANLAADTLAEVTAAAERGIQSHPAHPLAGVFVPPALRPVPMVNDERFIGMGEPL